MRLVFALLAIVFFARRAAAQGAAVSASASSGSSSTAQDAVAGLASASGSSTGSRGTSSSASSGSSAAPSVLPPEAPLTTDESIGPATMQPPPATKHWLHTPRPSGDKADYTTRRYEPAGFPLLGGDSDIGFEFGVVGTLSHFANGIEPFDWNMDLLAAISLKEGPSGIESAQQSFLWQIDLPGRFGGRVRFNPEASYNHTINYGYFGLGNASSGAPPPSGTPNPDRYHEWIDSVVQARSTARVAIAGPLSALFAAQYLYVAPSIYAGSVLANDAAAATSSGPRIYGTRPLSLPSFAAGFVYDSRDSEIFAHKGMLHEVGVRLEQGFPLDGDVRYAEVGGIFRGYLPLVGPLVVAARVVANFQFGHVPFYDLFQAGPFDQKEMPGGSAGVRGVPVGRYLGPIKLLGNVELRAMLVEFTVLKQKFTLGNDVFFDTGRVWSDYSFRSSLDGRGVGLKYGVGGGIYVQWGQAALLRIEAAYSPDAVSENPSLPVGIYVNDQTMF